MLLKEVPRATVRGFPSVGQPRWGRCVLLRCRAQSCGRVRGSHHRDLQSSPERRRTSVLAHLNASVGARPLSPAHWRPSIMPGSSGVRGDEPAPSAAACLAPVSVRSRQKPPAHRARASLGAALGSLRCRHRDACRAPVSSPGRHSPSPRPPAPDCREARRSLPACHPWGEASADTTLISAESELHHETKELSGLSP